MVCYNGADLLPQAFSSLRAQTFEDWELLFFDNGSTDGGSDLARAFDRRTRLLGGRHRLSFGAARAAAAAEARGDILAFLDHDDLWRADKLERQVRTLDGTGADLCYSDCAVIDEAGDELGRYASRVAPKDGQVYAALLEENFIPSVTVALKRSVYDAVGPFDPSLELPADYELWLRVAKQGRVSFDPECLASYRIRPGSLTSDRDGAYEQVDALFEHLVEHAAEPEERVLISRGWAAHRWRWALRTLHEGGGLGRAWQRFRAGWSVAPGTVNAVVDVLRMAWRLPRGLPVRLAMARARRGY